MEELNEQLSIYLKMLRVKHKLSQQEIADKLQVTRQTYTRWENNPIKLELDTIIKIGKIMNEDMLIFFNSVVAKSN